MAKTTYNIITRIIVEQSIEDDNGEISDSNLCELEVAGEVGISMRHAMYVAREIEAKAQSLLGSD